MTTAVLSQLNVGNPEAGGPRVYLSDTFAETRSAMMALLPDMADNDGTLTFGVNEVQTVTVTAGGGTFTLTYAGQTTAGIVYNAAASAVQTALEALSNIATGDVVVTGNAGGPYTLTFGGTLGNQDVALLTASATSLTGEGAAVVVAEATKGVRWHELPEIENEVKVKFIEKSEDIIPVYQMFRSSDVIVERGVGTIGFQYPRRSVAALKQMLEAAAIEQEAAGAAQVECDILNYGAGFVANQYRHAAMVFKNEYGFWTCFIWNKVRVAGNLDLTFGNKHTVIPNELKVFAHLGSGFGDTDNIFTIVQMTGAKSS